MMNTKFSEKFIVINRGDGIIILIKANRIQGKMSEWTEFLRLKHIYNIFMKKTSTTIWQKLKQYKWWLVGLLVIGIAAAVFLQPQESSIETVLVERGSLTKVVDESGVIQPVTEIDLAFETSGKVLSVNVAEGDQVAEGEVIARLDSEVSSSALLSAQAQLASALAGLDQLRNGATASEVAVTASGVASSNTNLANAEANLELVKSQQDELVQAAAETLRSTGLTARLVDGGRENSDDSFMPPTISGTYESDEEGQYLIELYRSAAQSGSSARLSGLESGTVSVSTTEPQPLGSRGLYIQFPPNFADGLNVVWSVEIPNKQSVSYQANLNNYNLALENRKVAITQAENAVNIAEAGVLQSTAQLNQVVTPARSEAIRIQQAAVDAARANVQSAQNSVGKSVLISPIDGLVTKVLISEGEIASAMSPAVSLISSDSFEIVIPIAEDDIAELEIGDRAIITFDAYDSYETSATVVSISPQAEIVDNVSTFEVKLGLDEVTELIRAGLSVDAEIIVAEKTEVITVPTRAIIDQAENSYVRVLISEDEYNLVKVETGIRGEGRIEVLSGIQTGDEIISFIEDEDLDAMTEIK